VAWKVVSPSKWPFQLTVYKANKKKLMKGVRLWLKGGHKTGYMKFRFGEKKWILYTFKYENPPGLWGITLWDPKGKYVCQCEVKKA
jgi:hypothetical protein